jgi:hypothetical protein
VKKNPAMTRVLASLIFSASLSGCGAVCEEQIDGPYYLIAIDERNSLSVSFQVEPGMYTGRIEGEVVAVGWDSEHIVAKRIAVGTREPEFYVLTRKADSTYADPGASVEGPLSSADFQQRVRAGAIPRLRELQGCSVK